MTIDFQELDRWGWDCPNCGEWHEEDQDPKEADRVYCGECGGSFSTD